MPRETNPPLAWGGRLGYSSHRGTESEEQIKVRSANAAAEMAYMDKPGFFDSVLLNGDLEKAYTDLKSLIAKSHPETAAVLTPSP